MEEQNKTLWQCWDAEGKKTDLPDAKYIYVPDCDALDEFHSRGLHRAYNVAVGLNIMHSPDEQIAMVRHDNIPENILHEIGYDIPEKNKTGVPLLNNKALYSSIITMGKQQWRVLSYDFGKTAHTGLALTRASEGVGICFCTLPDGASYDAPIPKDAELQPFLQFFFRNRESVANFKKWADAIVEAFDKKEAEKTASGTPAVNEKQPTDKKE